MSVSALKQILLTAIISSVVFGLYNGIPRIRAAITASSRVIPYQGRLTDSSGNNVADGSYAMTFKIYTVSTGGSSSFTEAHSSVSVSSGLFSVLLGSLSASGVNLDFANPPYYLGITIASNSEMSPRIQLGFVPLAHNAQYLDGNTFASIAQVPSGLIGYFATTCPTGWSEYTTARGMYIVGNPSGGTLATAVGTALTNLENRPVGQHYHSSVTVWTSGPYGAGGIIGQSVTGVYDNLNTGTTGSVAGTNAPYIQLTACKKD